MGSDRAVFSTALSNASVDEIQDVNMTADRILLGSTVLQGLSVGRLAKAGFAMNLTGDAGDENDRITCETDTGRLTLTVTGLGRQNSSGLPHCRKSLRFWPRSSPCDDADVFRL